MEGGAETVVALLTDLAAKATVPNLDGDGQARPPRVVLAVDQGEELFLSEGQDEADAFLALISDLAKAERSNLIVLFTIRSDSFERLQAAPALEGLGLQTFNLPPMPRGAYQTVIEGPAKRLADSERALTVEPALTAALLADIEDGGGKDALPLLAFTLQRLYEEYGTGGKATLTLAQYRELGGIRGSIAAAVAGALHAADADPAVPRDADARLALLRRALIPWLAGIDLETGSPRRRVARLSEIPDEARPLVEHLIAARLLSTDVAPDTGERTVEPAHEALLRQWGLLQGWLEEDFAALTTLEGVRRAARDWAANGKDEAWLAHAAGRLEDAEAVARRDDFAGTLAPTDRAYLAAARAADDARRNRELEEARKLAEAQRKVARRTRMGLIAASVLFVAALGAAVFGFVTADKALRNETFGLAALSQAERLQGRPSDALKLALVAWPRAGSPKRPQLARTVDVLAAALAEHRQLAVLRNDGRVLVPAFSSSGDRVVTIAEKSVRAFDAQSGEELAAIEWDGGKSEGDRAAVSPDGSRAVTALDGKPAILWNMSTGKRIAELAPLAAIAFSPDNRLVAGISGGSIRLWNAATGAESARFAGRSDLTSIAFSPDGKRLMTTGTDVRLWDATSGVESLAFGAEAEAPKAASFSPDGTGIVTTGGDGTATIRDAATGAALAVLKTPGIAVLQAMFLPDKGRVLTTGSDGVARLWDAGSGKPLGTFGEVSTKLVMVALSPDGTTLATSQSDRSVTLWDVRSGRSVATLSDHGARVYGMAFSPDGRRLVTASADNTARIWDARVPRQPRVLAKDDVRSVRWSPDGRHIATISGDRTIRVYDATDKSVAALPFAGVLTADFSPDGRRIVSGSAGGTVHVRDATTGAEIVTLKGHEAAVLSAAFSPDGSRIVTASGDKTARVWDAATGAEFAVLHGHQDIVFDALFSRDGKRILTQSRDGTVRLWDAQSGEQMAVATLDGSASGVMPSPDLRTMAVLSPDGPPGLRDVGKQTRIADLGSAPVMSLAYSPDGTQVATGAPGGAAAVWEVATGARRAVFKGHEGMVDAVAFSPDGERIVTGGADGTVRIWDVSTGAQLAVLNGREQHPSEIGSVSFAPDGARVATVSLDGSARVWDVSQLEKGSAFAVACRRLGNDTGLAGLRARYHLGELSPICGDHASQAVDWNRLE